MLDIDPNKVYNNNIIDILPPRMKKWGKVNKFIKRLEQEGIPLGR